ncbi:AAA family ATPase [Xanthomonas translucens]|uniref:AAA family ATPase n=1 Tax=Xanthomonas campestris pv. translucens TaxID=343 RepID=UPI0018C65F81|nr:AAA family ATPase [Xanthomonas translucens]
MIESITISGIATYAAAPEHLNDLSKFNFLFGSNGTGKTTVSRVIANEAKYPTCNVTWKAGTRLQPLVYNHDFVEGNFNQSAELKGVFTLGEKQVDVLAKIATAKNEFDALIARIENLTQGLQGANGNGGKKGDLATLRYDLKISAGQKNKSTTRACRVDLKDIETVQRSSRLRCFRSKHLILLCFLH